jgi:hypothetical protein
VILFKKDWDRYPKAIIDTDTKNKSFVRLSALYREMGVENHSFILSLLNPALQGIDPHRADLGKEIYYAIALECKENFFYFLREVVRIPGKSSVNPVLFNANRGNIALFWLFFNHVETILVQIRQTGKSISSAVLLDYLLNIRCVNTEINLLTKGDVNRAKTLDDLKKIDQEFPFYLCQRRKDDIANTEQLSVRRLGNMFKAHVPNASPKMALGKGRGLTSGIFDIDEAAYIQNIEITLPAALAAGIAARDIARQNNEPYGTMLTTTAGKKDDRDGRYVYNLLINSAEWSEKLFDCKNKEHLEEVIRKNSPQGRFRVNCTLNHRQLGYTDEWLKRAIEESNAVGDDVKRDFLNIWTSGSQTSPLTIALADKIRASERNVNRSEISVPNAYIIRWYFSEEEIKNRHNNGHFIISCDSSDAVGADDIAFHFRDIKTGETLGAVTINETNLISVCEWIVMILTTYFNSTIIIERRSSGAYIIDYLLRMLPAKEIDPFQRLYNRVVHELDEFPARYREVASSPLYSRTEEFYSKYKKLFGFATSGGGISSRSELYSTTLTMASKVTGHVVYDKKTIDQILSLIIKNNRVDHPDGEHDDSCIAWLLSAWLLFSGKNLEKYGVNRYHVLSNNITGRTKEDIDLRIATEEQQLIRKNIEDTVKQISKEHDRFIILRLENDLRILARKVILTENETFSVDDLLRKIDEDRKTARFAESQRFYSPYTQRY